jgi:hypothetical protein
MNKLRFGTSLLTVTASLVMGTSINQVVMAEEVIAESTTQPAVTNEVIATSITPETSETRPQPGTFSYDAVDLLAKRPLDLNKFCKDYPLNSRCANRPDPSTQPSQEAKPTEETSKTPAKTSGWAITPEISTLGVGATVTKSVTPNINAKLGITGLGISADIEESGISYDAKLNLFNVSTLVDYHPWQKSGFRLTGGLVFQDNNIEGTGKATNGGTTININGTDYPINPGDTVKTKISLPNSVAPYLGIGWGNAVKPGNRWGFSANLGVMFAGSPKVELTAPGYIPAADVEAERKQLQDDLDWLSIYPVLSLGLSYQF